MVRALLMGDVPAIVTYRRISALHFVLLPPRANVPAQRTGREIILLETFTTLIIVSAGQTGQCPK